MVATRDVPGESVTMWKDADSARVAEIARSIWNNLRPPAMAILARNHFLLEKLDRILEEQEAPHEYIGRTTALTNSEPFRRYHAFLKLAINPYDNFSFLLIKDIIGLPRADYSGIRVLAAKEGLSHFQVWFRRAHGGLLALYEAALSLAETVSWICTLYPELSPEASAFILAWDEDNFGSIEDYLNFLALYEVADEMKDKTEGIQLLTIHAAKGLEWPAVIIAGCNEEIIPSKQSIANGDLESEVRLMYVACTRARDQLIITVRPEREEKNGRVYESPQSRFVDWLFN